MTEQKADAWMPLWIGAYMADTMTFTTAQHGAYLLLLMAYWRERVALPDDDEQLRAITRASKAEWAKLRPVLARKFKVEGGVWWHKRVEAEIAAADARSKKAAEKAKKAANARWKHGDEHPSSNAPSIPKALHEECPTPSPTPSPSESSEANASGAADAPPAVDKSTETEKRKAWRDCGNWFVTNGTAETTAREVMGKVIKDYPAVALDAFVAAAKHGATPDPEAYLIATAKRMAGEQRTVPSAEAEKTAEYLGQSAEQKAAAMSPEAHEARRAAMARLGRVDGAGHSPRAAA